MKKIIGALLCVLIAGSALVQSCKKPDATPDLDPVDSSQVVVPVTPKTEQEIIQWAVNKLPGKYLMTGRMWDFADVSIYDIQPNYPYTRTRAPDTSGPSYQGGNPVLYQKNIEVPYKNQKDSNIIISFYQSFVIQNGKTSFYDKIFVDEVGDSFIGAMCGSGPLFGGYGKCGSGSRSSHNLGKHKETSNEIQPNMFFNVSNFNDVTIDSGKYGAFYEGPDQSGSGNPSTKGREPIYQIKYYYNKDSLSLFQADFVNTHASNMGGTRWSERWYYRFGYNYGNKIK